ncbi:MAG: sterol desaturase family protein [Candidatus Cloacimonetes bacterium]|nr:sterol desaturase family protein [Candidatus Cloacimonadota bacterium]
MNQIFITVGIFIFVIPFFILSKFTSTVLAIKVSSQPQILQLFEGIIIAEFFGYWIHRLHHKVPFLWKLHAIHHSPKDLDWLAAVRVHPLNVILNRLFATIPLLFLGFSKESFGGAIIFIQFYSLFFHANINIRLHKLSYLIGTPELHRVHHSKDIEESNCNFGGLTPIFDQIFGTFKFPDQLPKEYGVEEDTPTTYIAQLKFPFQSKDK